MSIHHAVTAARRAAGKRMRAALYITRPDPVDPHAAHTPVYGTPEAPGRGYVRYPGLAHEQRPEAAGARLTQTRVVVRIPHGVQVTPHDVVHILTDPDNPQLDGSAFVVGSTDDQSQTSAQRLLCLDFQAGR